jgi:hypothetical protein
VVTQEELNALFSIPGRYSSLPSDGYRHWRAAVDEQVDNIWSEARRTVPCPFCGAPAGEGCHVRYGSGVTLTHDAREHVYVGYRQALMAVEASLASLTRGAQ